MDFLLIGALVACFALLLLICLLVYQLILQNGRILVRLDALEEMPWDDASLGIEEYVATLPLGVSAPSISLPDLSGTVRSLSELRGQRLLLVFFDPGCGFCRTLLPSLVALTNDVVAGRPIPVVISTGEVEVNRALFDKAGFANLVLLQTATEVAAAYKVDGTPMSYLIEADGTIASEIAVGVQALLILAGEIGAVTDATATYEIGNEDEYPANLEATVRLRDGLKAGATARFSGYQGSMVESSRSWIIEAKTWS